MTDHHKGPPAGLTGTTDHIDAGDGWLIVRLLTKQALLREGEHMDHCVGDGSYEHLAGDEDLTSDAIWSLRDPDGVSQATLDVRAGTGGRRHVVMAKGPRNRQVRRSDARRLQALVMTFRAAGVDFDFAGETRLVMADDGRVMREDQAPEDVREQARVRHGVGRSEERLVPLDGMSLMAYAALIQTHRAFLRLQRDLIDGEVVPRTAEPLLSDRVAIGVDTQAPRYGAGGFPGGGGVNRWSEDELRDILTVGGSGGYPGGGGGSGVAVSRGGGYVMISTPSTRDPIIGDLG